MNRDEALEAVRRALSDARSLTTSGVNLPIKAAICHRLSNALAALEADPPCACGGMTRLAEDAGPLRFDHLGFPSLHGQHITVPLRGEWVSWAGLEEGAQLRVLILEEKPCS